MNHDKPCMRTDPITVAVYFHPAFSHNILVESLIVVDFFGIAIILDFIIISILSC